MIIGGTLLVIVGLLFVPDPDTGPLHPGGREPFVWNQDAYWSALEARFKEAKESDCNALDGRVQAEFSRIRRYISVMATSRLRPDAELFAGIEQSVFEIAPILAACPGHLAEYLQLLNQIRFHLKRQSWDWAIDSSAVRNRMYRILYGIRAAAEEVMLQADPEQVPSLVKGFDEPSVTPTYEVLGLMLHSGDVLVSRGGAPTSALIARGNDYPGNFSHVALVYVDSTSGEISILESHIEKGVTISSLEEYVDDIKLRVLVLRLRHDLPFMVKDPLLPHRAATTLLREAQRRHIPYDFAMDFSDASEMFCSEVASTAYARNGVTLWMGVSSISGSGIISWLGALGVRNFITQEPSDLEYDPQLRVVGEWRNPETLYKDHIDNAVIDIMLEKAEAGQPMEYSWYLLPIARTMKAYSVVLNVFGGVGPVPEGMNATAALRVQWFTTAHDQTAEAVYQKAGEFKAEKGYTPPYWELVRLARESWGQTRR